MEEFDDRPRGFGSCSTPSVLRPFRQRLFLGAIGGYAALNLVVGFPRNQLLLEQTFLGTKPACNQTGSGCRLRPGCFRADSMNREPDQRGRPGRRLVRKLRWVPHGVTGVKQRAIRHHRKDSPAIALQLAMIVIPTLLSLPAMFFPVPPLMVFLPTPLAFGVQIATPVFGLATTLTVVLDGLIQSCLRLFDGMLAL